MRQSVKNLNYLAVMQVNLADLKENKIDIAILPTGAEIISVSLEILQKTTSNITADIGYADNTGLFLNDIDLTKDTGGQSVISKTNPRPQALQLSINQKSSDGIVKTRVHYFLPSEIIYEI